MTFRRLKDYPELELPFIVQILRHDPRENPRPRRQPVRIGGDHGAKLAYGLYSGPVLATLSGWGGACTVWHKGKPLLEVQQTSPGVARFRFYGHPHTVKQLYALRTLLRLWDPKSKLQYVADGKRGLLTFGGVEYVLSRRLHYTATVPLNLETGEFYSHPSVPAEIAGLV